MELSVVSLVRVDCYCLDDDMSQPLATLSCSHKFHAECILKWLNRDLTCPACRHRITATERSNIRFDYKVVQIKGGMFKLFSCFMVFCPPNHTVAH